MVKTTKTKVKKKIAKTDKKKTKPTNPTASPKTNTKKVARKTNYLNNKDLLAEVIKSKERGQMTDKLARMLQMLTARYGKKGNFANYCVDDLTQALTKGGWKRYDEITTDDTILSYDPATKNLVWSAVKDVYINTNYDGPMHRLDAQGIDAFVTPNHKFVSAERGIIPVENVGCDEHIVLMGQGVEDPPKVFSDAEIVFIGWAVTKGRYIKESAKKHRITITYKEGPKSEKIQKCLRQANIPHKRCSLEEDLVGVEYTCTGDFVSKIYSTLAPNQVLSEELILSLTQQQRILLIETIINADGRFSPSGGMLYIQKDPKHIDAFLMLCTIAGLTTSTTSLEHKASPSDENLEVSASDGLAVNIFSKPKLQCKVEQIDFHGGRPTSDEIGEQNVNAPTEHHNGVIWCPQTEYGTFVCRRNKYIYVTGNTYNEDMQAYAMLMIAKTWNSFDPDKSKNPFAFYTQCIKNSFVQYLNQERRQRDIRDSLLVNSGMAPSYTYQMEHEARSKMHNEVDHHDQHLDNGDEVVPSSNENDGSDDLIQY